MRFQLDFDQEFGQGQPLDLEPGSGRTAAVVAAMYSTLGLSGILVGVRPTDEQAGLIFFVAMLLIGTTVLTQGLRIRPGGTEIAVGLGIAAV